MKIVKVGGSEIKLKPKTIVTYVKLGTPGKRRWHAVYVPVGSHNLHRLPVRDIHSISAGK